MNIKLIYTFFLVFLAVTVNAQNCPHVGESMMDFKEFEQQKVAFITTEMKLTTDEAAKFWPVYLEMSKKVHKLEHERRGGWYSLQKDETTEQQTQETIAKLLEMEKTIIQLKQEFYCLMLKQIPATKLAKLEMAKILFHRNLINKLRKKGHVKLNPINKS